MSAVINYPGMILIPAQSGRVSSATGGNTFGVFRLPTDPLKYVDLTFDGVVAGSEIRAFLNSTGAELFGVESCDANHAFAGVPYFGTGQVCAIRIINTAYRIKEFAYTIPAVDQVIPIQMEPDKWFSNP